MKKNLVSNDEFLFDLAYTVFKRKYLILAVFVTTFIGIILGTYLVTPLWQGQAKVQIQMNPKTQLSLFDDLATPAPVQPNINPANNLIQILTSRSMAEQIVATYGRDAMLKEKCENPQATRDIIKCFLKKILIEIPIGFFRLIGLLDESPDTYFADAVKEVQEDLMDVELEEETEVLNVSIWGENPKLATEMANTMVQSLVERVQEFTRGPIEDTYNSSLGQFNQIERELHEAQEALRLFKEQTQVVQMDEEQRTCIRRIDEMENELAEVRSDQVENEKRLQEAANQLNQQAELVLTEEVIGDNPIVLLAKTKLSELEAQVSSARLEKTDFHPDVAGMNAEITHFQEQLKNELQRIVQTETKSTNPVYESLVSQLVNLEVEQYALKGKEQALQKECAKVHDELNQFPAKEMGLARLANVVEIKQATYNNVKAKLDELAIMKENNMSSYTLNVIDNAHVYDDVPPDWPKWILNLPAGLIGSLLLALGFAFFVEYWDNSYKTVKDIEEDLELPVVGSLPDLGKDFGSLYQRQDAPNLRLAYDKLADSLLLGREDGKMKTLLITSVGPGEGRTSTAINLALTLSHREKKALLVDADLRNPSVARMLNLRETPGLTDIFLSDTPLNEAIQEVNSLLVIPAGATPQQIPPFEILSSAKLQAFLKNTASQFDVVLIDSASVKRHRDPLMLSSLVDGTLLVVEANKTQKRSILMAHRKIEEAGGKLKGIILNKQVNPIPAFILER